MSHPLPIAHGHVVALLLIGPEIDVRSGVRDLTAGCGVFTVCSWSACILEVLDAMTGRTSRGNLPVAVVHGLKSRSALSEAKGVFANAGLPTAVVWTASEGMPICARRNGDQLSRDDADWHIEKLFGFPAAPPPPHVAALLLSQLCGLRRSRGVEFRLGWNDQYDLRGITQPIRWPPGSRTLLDPLTLAFAQARKSADQLTHTYNALITSRCRSGVSGNPGHVSAEGEADCLTDYACRRDTEHGYVVTSAATEYPSAANEAWVEFRVQDFSSDEDAAPTQ